MGTRQPPPGATHETSPIGASWPPAGPDRSRSSLRPALDGDYRALGEAHFLWFQAVKEMGMPPMDALLAAARTVAEAYHVVRRSRW
jgi:hypothetical protein